MERAKAIGMSWRNRREIDNATSGSDEHGLGRGCRDDDYDLDCDCASAGLGEYRDGEDDGSALREMPYDTARAQRLRQEIQG
jgi:hypothetical protein